MIINNRTPFKELITILPDPDGVDMLHIILRASFQTDYKCTVLEKQLSPVIADEYWDDPESYSLRYPSDIHTGKPVSEIILLGQAWAPDGGEAECVDVSLQADTLEKTIRVYGDRWIDNSLMGLTVTSPESFRSIPLVFERAYGGFHIVDEKKGEIYRENRNPVGVGFKGKRNKELIGTPAPNLEDPSYPFKGPSNKGMPACFGPIAPWWEPRKMYAGTYDAHWQETRAPFLPVDFNPLFNCCADSSLRFNKYVTGGEKFLIRGAHPEGNLAFALPSCAFDVGVSRGHRTVKVQLVCETIIIEPDENRFSMTFRGMLRGVQKLTEIDTVRITLAKIKGATL